MALAVQGFPPEEELKSAWLQIQQQYVEAIGSSDYEMYWRTAKELSELTGKIQMVYVGLKALRSIHIALLSSEGDEELRNKLEKEIDEIGPIINTILGTSFDFKSSETFDSIQTRCVNRCKGMNIQAAMLEPRLEAVQKKLQSGEVPDESYFRKMLVLISDSVGYHIPDNIVVFEFCLRIKNLINGNRVNR
jgi:hypothetical protein